jgi:hypothetical protein
VAYVTSLSRTYRLMNALVVTPTVIAALRAELVILHELVGRLPPTMWRQPLHYTKHFPEQMLQFGPTADHTMWKYEDMFGRITRSLNSRKHPVLNVLKSWGNAFALRSLTAFREFRQRFSRDRMAPPFRPDNRPRSDKGVVKVGERVTSVSHLAGVQCDQVKAWYRKQPVYLNMEAMHAVAKELLSDQPNDYRYIQP